MKAMVYDSNPPFATEEPPLALTERVRMTVMAAYLMAEVLKPERRQLAKGLEIAGKEFEQMLAEYEAEMKAWSDKLQVKAKELTEEEAARRAVQTMADQQPETTLTRAAATAHAGSACALVEPDLGARRG